jgi:hypothetical protein
MWHEDTTKLLPVIMVIDTWEAKIVDISSSYERKKGECQRGVGIYFMYF